MATYEVSTWAELVSELSTSRAEAKTIKLVADIDCNDEIPLGVASTITCYCSLTHPVVLDGSYIEDGVTKNHAIRNLRTHVTNPVILFSISVRDSSKNFRFTFKNIDFINLILQKAYFMTMVNQDWYSSSNSRIIFDNCRIVGRRDKPFTEKYGWRDSSNQIVLNSCFFNIPYMSATPTTADVPLFGDWYITDSSTNRLIYANFCWFRSNYDGWAIDNGSSMTILQFIKLNGCYVDGEIVGSNELVLSTQNSQYSYNSAIQNVVDADIRLIRGSNSANMYMPKGVWKNDVRSYSDPSVVYTTVNRNSNAIPESPEDMKNPAKLYADGFDIVVP